MPSSHPEVLFLGLDLTSSPERPSAAALLRGRKVEAFFLPREDEEILALARIFRPHLVAVDSPLGFPQGLCCLEESCSCRPLSPLPGRICERELLRRGIPCFFTTKRSIIKEMVYRALKLRSSLEAEGLKVIEVYPYATKVILLGRKMPKKSKREGLEFLRRSLLVLFENLSPFSIFLSHDLADALLAAYTAYLHFLGRTEILGIEEEGQIVIPQRAPL